MIDGVVRSIGYELYKSFSHFNRFFLKIKIMRHMYSFYLYRFKMQKMCNLCEVIANLFLVIASGHC